MLSNLPALYIKLKGKPGMKQLREVETEIRSCLKSTQGNLYLLVDASEMDGLAIDLKHMKQAIGFTHPNIDKVIVFGGGLAIRSLLTILARFSTSERLRYFGNESDAMAYLQRRLGEAAVTTTL